jgi:phage terminase large subunit-like protein
VHAALEDQLCSWTPGDSSPDRLDALVWAVTALMLEAQPQRVKSWEY